MLLAVLSRTLKQILSQDSNCETIFEKARDRQTNQTSKETFGGRSEKSISSVHAGSTKQTLPDPWFK